jgi:uncharacterized integral membrane protein
MPGVTDTIGWRERGRVMGDNGERTGRRLITNGRLFGLVIAALLSILLVLFVLDNFVLIEIRLVNARIQMRLAWAVLISVLAGGALGFLAGRYLR